MAKANAAGEETVRRNQPGRRGTEDGTVPRDVQGKLGKLCDSKRSQDEEDKLASEPQSLG